MLHLTVLDTAVTHIYDTTYANSYAFMDSVYYQSGTYYREAGSGANGCDSSVFLHLLFCDSVITELYDTICNDTVYVFNEQLLSMSGQYVHNTRTSLGCDSIVVLHLTVVDYPTLELVDSGNYCYGGVATLKANTNGNEVWWSSVPPDSTLVGQENNATIYVSPTEYTVYTVVADSMPRPKSCPVTASIAVNKASKVEAKIMVDPEVLEVSRLQARFTDVSRGDVVYRRWQIAESDPMAQQRMVTDDSIVWHTASANSDSIVATLFITDVNGCDDSTERSVPIQRGELWVPNAFTPDGNDNTLFKVGAVNVTFYEISIYNRGGLLVYHSTDVNESWDGTHKGQKCVEGSYVYVIVYQTKSNTRKTLKKVGSVLLIR